MRRAIISKRSRKKCLVPFMRILVFFGMFISQFTLSGENTLSDKNFSQKSVKYFLVHMNDALFLLKMCEISMNSIKMHAKSYYGM
ncbi:exported hypothetical protein [Desulfamplus magnetovallimortis]|uniref:Uncharacterized protein n=1 Tax=Desulfamplus magnetovallimortis TaxID=1246637 RepID=L0R568_9BACT|nr:exported hypothetical protein [Desulfamplus magnetovallimortis BW-1]SLM32748.1 exported hypothetical protein [Desulfamplus magnetovallimortis]